MSSAVVQPGKCSSAVSVAFPHIHLSWVDWVQDTMRGLLFACSALLLAATAYAQTSLTINQVYPTGVTVKVRHACTAELLPVGRFLRLGSHKTLTNVDCLADFGPWRRRGHTVLWGELCHERSGPRLEELIA